MFKNSQAPQVIAAGLALFSMFFGSGNLIFPLSVGVKTSQFYIPGGLGFLTTAVLVPFAGVVTMLMFAGNYQKFFSYFNKPLGALIAFVLLVFWVPLGSGPRCITLSYASLSNYAPDLPLWAFSLVYSCVVFLLSYRKTRVLDILGFVLTPLLLLSIGVIVGAGLNGNALPALTTLDSQGAFWLGALEGYNTMDLVASFFFASSIIGILKTTRPDRYIQSASMACVVGIVMLTLVYLLLMFIASLYGAVLEGTPKDMLLPTLAQTVLGRQNGSFASLTISLACLTTSIALTTVFAEYLNKQLIPRLSYRKCLAFSTALNFAVSTLGFANITKLSTPVFQILYPLLIVLMVAVLFCEGWRRRSP